jgi:hypothetical protein
MTGFITLNAVDPARPGLSSKNSLRADSVKGIVDVSGDPNAGNAKSIVIIDGESGGGFVTESREEILALLGFPDA